MGTLIQFQNLMNWPEKKAFDSMRSMRMVKNQNIGDAKSHIALVPKEKILVSFIKKKG